MDIHAPPGTGINSDSAEERIKARQERIKARLLRRKNKQEGKTVSQADEKSSKEQESQQWDSDARRQVRASRAAIDHAIDVARDATSAIRVAGDGLEAERRFTKEQQGEDRQFKLARLQEQSDEANAAIALIWSTLLDVRVPQDLLAALMQQKGRCDDVIASKDNMLAALTQELESQDDEYVRELKRQAERIDELLGIMSDRFRDMQSVYARELASLEATFEAELDALERHCAGQIAMLMERRARLEESHTADRLALLRANQDEIEELHRKHGEGLNIVTVKLQSSVQILRQQLEEMRATYALNSQKLDYNIKILERREYENSITISQQKRKINGLMDQVTALKSRYEKQDAAYRAENVKLTADYRRITEQYKELQRKFRHFQLADARRFKEVWDMSEEAVAGMVGRTLQADKIIHEQQLGLAWSPPAEDVFRAPNSDEAAAAGPSGAAAAAAAAVGSAAGTPGGAAPAHAGTASESASPPGSRESTRGAATISVLAQGSTDTARRILQLICDEAGFLVEEKVQALLDPLERDERSQLMIKSIFKALKISRRAEIDKLLSYFVRDPGAFDVGRYMSEVRGTNSAGSSAGSKTSDDDDNDNDDDNDDNSSVAERRSQAMPRRGVVDGETIAPDEVIAALRQFVQDHNRDLDLTRQSTKRSTSLMFMREQKQRSRQAEKDYWERLGHVVPVKTFRVWQALEKTMRQYNQVLEARASLAAGNEQVRAQNAELKTLLNQYLRQSVNAELFVPPAATETLFDQAK